MANMIKGIKHLNLPVSFIKEGKQFVAWTPALDLSTAGRSIEEVKKNFAEAVGIFFEEIIAAGTLEDVLLDLGWKHQGQEFIPPVISQGVESVKIHFA